MSAAQVQKLVMLKDYLTVTDNQRGTNFLNTFPELNNLF
jgi:hypothetical protein